MIIVDNFLPVSLQDKIQQLVDDKDFPWYFSSEIYSEMSEEHKRKTPSWDDSKVSYPVSLSQVVFYDGKVNSSHFHLFNSILDFLEMKTGIDVDQLMRIRIRRTTQTVGHTKDMYNIPHVDNNSSEPYKTFVYYIDESDGDTIMFDRYYTGNDSDSKNFLNVVEKNSPVRGTGILFDGLRYHAGNCPIKYKKRTILNFDFTVK